jgi:S-adenosylmethionine decarboxylase
MLGLPWIKRLKEVVSVGLHVGIHILAELCGCEPDVIARKGMLEGHLLRAIEGSGLNAVGGVHHQFNPHGVTSLVVLRESHISLHTWPEHRYVAVDIFTCGSYRKAYLFIRNLASELKATSLKRIIIKRGITNEEDEETGTPVVEGEVQVFLESG